MGYESKHRCTWTTRCTVVTVSCLTQVLQNCFPLFSDLSSSIPHGLDVHTQASIALEGNKNWCYLIMRVDPLEPGCRMCRMFSASYRGAQAGLVPGLQQCEEDSVVMSLRVTRISGLTPQVGFFFPPFLDLSVEILQRVLTVCSAHTHTHREIQTHYSHRTNLTSILV